MERPIRGVRRPKPGRSAFGEVARLRMSERVDGRMSRRGLSEVGGRGWAQCGSGGRPMPGRADRKGLADRSRSPGRRKPRIRGRGPSGATPRREKPASESTASRSMGKAASSGAACDRYPGCAPRKHRPRRAGRDRCNPLRPRGESATTSASHAARRLWNEFVSPGIRINSQRRQASSKPRTNLAEIQAFDNRSVGLFLSGL